MLINKEDGQITIFISLCIVSFLALVLTCYEVARVEFSSTKVERSLHTAINSTLADYNIELKEKYHILALDETYNEKGDERLIGRIYEEMDYNLKSKNQKYSIENIMIEPIYITDYSADLFKYEIRQYMKYESIDSFIENIKDKFNNNKESSGQTSDLGQELLDKQEQYNQEMTEKSTEKIDEDNINQVEGSSVSDPRDGLRSILSMGWMKFIVGNKKISKATVDLENLPSKDIAHNGSKEEKDVDIESVNGIVELLKFENNNLNLDAIGTEGLGIFYALEHFNHATELEKIENTKFKYEIEYLLMGKDNDYDNLSQTLKKIMGCRYPINFIHCISDSSKVQEALVVSTGLFAWTAMPTMIELGKYLIIGAWSYAETLVEIKQLFEGHKIPIIKNAENWNLSLTAMSKMNVNTQVSNQEKEEKGISYQDYISLFMITMNNSNLKYYRMMDLMQLNLQESNSKFKIKNMLFSYKVSVSVSIPYQFVPIKTHEKQFSKTYKKTASY